MLIASSLLVTVCGKLGCQAAGYQTISRCSTREVEPPVMSLFFTSDYVFFDPQNDFLCLQI